VAGPQIVTAIFWPPAAGRGRTQSHTCWAWPWRQPSAYVAVTAFGIQRDANEDSPGLIAQLARLGSTSRGIDEASVAECSTSILRLARTRGM
jgi:hypothetical protein